MSKRLPHPTDMARARKFAVQWATRDSDGEIANLARAFLRAEKAQELLDRMARAIDAACISSDASYEPTEAIRLILGYPEGSMRVLVRATLDHASKS